jgi:glycosyltransferase involved in cell wall biosynthesis
MAAGAADSMLNADSMYPTPSEVVSVVICAKNRAALIAATIEAVKRNRPREIIVIDDCSTDATGLVALKSGARVIRSQGRGLALARQLGAESATAPYVAFRRLRCPPGRPVSE